MKKNKALIFALCAIFMFSCRPAKNDTMTQILKEALQNAEAQYLELSKDMQPRDNLLPRTIDSDGNLVTSDSRWWTSGFFPGTLWYIYENSGNEKIKEYALLYTERVEREKYTTDNHDVGFMIFCSFGNAFRLTKDSVMEEVIHTAAHSLSTRYREKAECIQSWDHPDCPVIIDNMMNLELLMWASKYFQEDRFKDIAVNHANTTIKNHFRPDYSSYHVVAYDTATGAVQQKRTHQGFADESAWARGQAWGLYGYTMMYRETQDKNYLEQAQHIADFILNHPNLPADKIPYWDFYAPDIPNAKRDVSAGAIICSALIELSQYAENRKGKGTEYLSVAEQQLKALASPAYTAPQGSNGHFILMHSVGSLPHNSEVDVPLTYADYYYLEAITRYAKLKGITL